MKKRWIALAAGAAAVVVAVSSACAYVRMPGTNHTGPLAPLTEEEVALSAALQQDIKVLAEDIGERNYLRREALDRAATWVQQQLAATGADVVTRSFEVEGVRFDNFEIELRGTRLPDEIVVIGAHYDTAMGTPGANDNGSGVAVLLALARQAQKEKTQYQRTVRFVAFANEEPPFFGTHDMGSWRYAQGTVARREKIVAMLSLETMGCYSDVEGSQQYPFPFGLLYPSQGNFVGFVGDTGSVKLAHQVVASFRSHAAFPSEGAALPGAIPGIDWSDHGSFWPIGTPALMVTDTAPFRFQDYHRATDTPDKVDTDRLARVTRGLAAVVVDLATVN